MIPPEQVEPRQVERSQSMEETHNLSHLKREQQVERSISIIDFSNIEDSQMDQQKLFPVNLPISQSSYQKHSLQSLDNCNISISSQKILVIPQNPSNQQPYIIEQLQVEEQEPTKLDKMMVQVIQKPEILKLNFLFLMREQFNSFHLKTPIQVIQPLAKLREIMDSALKASVKYLKSIINDCLSKNQKGVQQIQLMVNQAKLRFKQGTIVDLTTLVYLQQFQCQDIVAMVREGESEELVDEHIKQELNNLNRQVMEYMLSHLRDNQVQILIECAQIAHQIGTSLDQSTKNMLATLQYLLHNQIDLLHQKPHQFIKTIEEGYLLVIKNTILTFNLSWNHPLQQTLKLNQIMNLKRNLSEKLTLVVKKVGGNDIDIVNFYRTLVKFAENYQQYTKYLINNHFLSSLFNRLQRQHDSDILTLLLHQKRQQTNTLTSNFDSFFHLPTNVQLYLKEYFMWSRGRRQQQKQLLYSKHLNLLNYLIITQPPSIIKYHRTYQIQQDKSFRFVMQKGTKSFLNFESGYTFFHSFQLKDKIRYIMDITEGLVQLHMHGITHNDVTFRNTVQVGDRFKIIDFDVARMGNKKVQVGLYSVQQLQLMGKYRKEAVRCSERLYNKELKQDKVVANSKMEQATPVQNLNRLSQFYNLYNINPVRQYLESNTQKSKGFSLTKQQAFRLLNAYQSLVIGKTDCGKFGLMLIKLMHRPQQNYSMQYLQVCVRHFMKQVYLEGAEGANYKQLLKWFLLDKEISPYTQELILKLVAQLFIPNLSLRMPMSLFALELLAILNIKHYGISLGHQSPYTRDVQYDVFIKQLSMRMQSTKEVNRILTQCLKESTFKYRQEVNKIFEIFKEALQVKRMQTLRFYQLLYHIKIDKVRPFEFKIIQPNQREVAAVNKLLQTIVNFNKRQLKQTISKFIQIRDEYKYICLTHWKDVEAICQQQRCQQKWLCHSCLMGCYPFEENNQDLQHCSRPQPIDQLYSRHTLYHKLVHLHSRQELSFAAVIGKDLRFGCCKCVEDLFLFPQTQQFMILGSNRTIKRQLCLEGRCRNDPFLMNSSLKLQHRLISTNFNQIIKKAEHKISHIPHNIFKQLEQMINDKERQLTRWSHSFDRIVDKLQQTVYSHDLVVRVQKITTVVKYLPKISNLLCSNYQDLKYYQDLLSLIQPFQNIQKVFQSTQCQILQINQNFDNFMTNIMKIITKIEEKREKWELSNDNLPNQCQITNQRANILKIKRQKQQIQSKSNSNFERVDSLSYSHSPSSNRYPKYQIWNGNASSKQCSGNTFNKSIISMTDMYQIQQRSFVGCLKCQQRDKQSPVIQVCLDQNCQYPLLCHKCSKFDQHNFMINLDLFSYPQTAIIEQELFNTSNLEDSMIKKFKKQMNIFFKRVKQNLAYKMSFISSLVIKGKQEPDKIHQELYKRLIETCREYNLRKFSEVMFMFIQITQDPVGYMKLAAHAIDMSINLLKKAIRQFDSQILNFSKSTSYPLSPTQTSLTLQHKYTKFIQQKQKPFYKIPHRYRKHIKNLSISKLAQSEVSVQHINEVGQIQQFIQKLVSNGYNMFEISWFVKYFRIEPCSYVSVVSQLEYLQVLCIRDQPKIDRPRYVKSHTLQNIIRKVPQLREIRLHCFNGFDHFCIRELISKKIKCKLEIQSLRELALESQELIQVFNPMSLASLPFRLTGQLLTTFNLPIQIISAQYELNLSHEKFHKTLITLKNLNTSPNCTFLKLTFNELNSIIRNKQDVTIFNLRKYFFIKEENIQSQEETSKIEEYCDDERQHLLKFIDIVHQKQIFGRVSHLILHGLIMDGTNKHQSKAVNNKLQFFMNNLPLVNFQLKKCFGIPLFILTSCIIQLQRLRIENCIFVKSSQIMPQQRCKITFLVLREVKVIGNSKYQDFASYLQHFRLPQLSTLILNDCQNLVVDHLLWLFHCPLKDISLRRCFLINHQIMEILIPIKTLTRVDLTSTLLKDQDLVDLIYHFQLVARNLTQIPNWNNFWIVEEINRIAIKYGIQNILKGQNYSQLPFKDFKGIQELTFKDQVFQEIDLFQFLIPLSFLPQVQLLQLKNCCWKPYNEPIVRSLQPLYDIPFIKDFQKLKQLFIINCQLLKFDAKQLNKYKQLRRLNLRNNQLQFIGDIKMQNLISLNLSGNNLRSFDLTPSNMAKLAQINLVQNKISKLGINILSFPNLRILMADSQIKGQLLKSQNVHQIIRYIDEPNITLPEFPQKICYHIKHGLKHISNKSWHLKMLLYNIQIDIKENYIPIQIQSYKNYLQWQDKINQNKQDHNFYDKLVDQ